MGKVLCDKCGEKVNHPLRVKYKIIFMVGIYWIDRTFLNFSRNLMWSSRGEKFRDVTIEETKKFYNSKIFNLSEWFTKRAIKYFFMILEDDNAYFKLFERILKRYKKEGLL